MTNNNPTVPPYLAAGHYTELNNNGGIDKTIAQGGVDFEFTLYDQAKVGDVIELTVTPNRRDGSGVGFEKFVHQRTLQQEDITRGTYQQNVEEAFWLKFKTVLPLGVAVTTYVAADGENKSRSVENTVLVDMR